jgi:hypothetical protein
LSERSSISGSQTVKKSGIKKLPLDEVRMGNSS